MDPGISICAPKYVLTVVAQFPQNTASYGLYDSHDRLITSTFTETVLENGGIKFEIEAGQYFSSFIIESSVSMGENCSLLVTDSMGNIISNSINTISGNSFSFQMPSLSKVSICALAAATNLGSLYESEWSCSGSLLEIDECNWPHISCAGSTEVTSLNFNGVPVIGKMQFVLKL